MKRLLIRSVVVLVSLVFVATVAIFVLLKGSLPQLEGEIVSDRLLADVTIARDSAGIPVITAENRLDLAFATGYAHGQDRFFQMDLLRRNSAGELAELFGEIALPADRHNSLHRFRTRAGDALKTLPSMHIEILESYSHGVNTGLSSLGAKQFEYYLLGEYPRPWESVDTLLVVYSMYMDLNDKRARRDVGRGLVHRVLSAAVMDWLYPAGTEWDAPLVGGPVNVSAIPGPDVYNLNGVKSVDLRSAYIENADTPVPGSNNWAVAGRLTESGAAIVANDMHLGIAVPPIWYRARLRTTETSPVDLNGVTLPGTPFLVAGSNGHIAYGNTNSNGDWTDAVIVKPGTDPNTYLTPDGPQPYVVHVETINVKGADAARLEVRETIWGPILEDHEDPDQEIAVSWIAHHIEGVNLAFVDLETATTVDEALKIANSMGIPPQNFVVGDAAGNIGWTIAGAVPTRAGYDPDLPADWSEHGGWQGWLAAEDYPRIVNPPSGRIWTANTRVVDGDALRLLGDGGYVLGARAGQIRDSLLEKDRFVAEDMLEIQLDDRAVFLSRWRDLLLNVLNSAATTGNDERQQYRKLAEDWNARASVDSVGYRLVRDFRSEVRDRVFTMLMQPVYARYGSDARLWMNSQFEGPLWSLVSEQPAHILTDNYSSWSELLLQSVDAVVSGYEERYDNGLQHRRWGERNTAAIRHPLSRAIPFLSRWLEMPADPLPGDSHMPRAQRPGYGASERFGVSPGDENNGYLHMPAGQSGHPLSPYFRAGHEDWVSGRPSEFLPGPAAHTLVLKAAP